MSLTTELIRKAIQDKNSEMLNRVIQITHPDAAYSNYCVMEYDGDVPRLFGDQKSIELLIPKEMSVIYENAVVDAIESGTLFDDKEDIDNKVKYITMTHLPHLGMMHRHMDEPHHLHHAVGMVVGAMNPDGHFGSSDGDMENGKNYTMDLTKHGDEKDTSVMDLTNDYLDIKDRSGKGTPVELKRSLAKIPDEVKEIKSVKEEDTVDDEDYEEIGLDYDTDDDDDHEISEDHSLDDDEEEDTKSKKKKKYDDEDDDDDHDKDSDKEKSIEKFLKGRKDDIDVDIDIEKEQHEFRGYPSKGDPPQKPVSYSNEAADTSSSVSRKAMGDRPISTTSSYDKGTTLTNALSALNSGNGGKTSYQTNPQPSSSVHSFNKSSIQKESHVYREYDEYEYYQETHAMLVKPKKLKPIPRDVIAYIITQKNNIRDANDQAMISGYCCSKLEMVDFYLNCLDVHDYRYIVPHNRQYLVQMQNDLNRCLQEILRIKPINRLDRVWKVNVTYPEGWGG